MHSYLKVLIVTVFMPVFISSFLGCSGTISLPNQYGDAENLPDDSSSDANTDDSNSDDAGTDDANTDTTDGNSDANTDDSNSDTIPDIACDLYVSPSGSGDVCTESDPCLIDYAKEHATAGNFICLFEGSYGELLFDSDAATGTTETWITYQSLSYTNKPHFTYITFDGTKIDYFLAFDGIRVDPGYVDEPRQYSGIINLRGANHVSFEKCDFEAEKIAGNIPNQSALAPYAFRGGILLGVGTNPGHATYITINNCTFRYGYNQVYMAGNSTDTVNVVHHWTITNNEFIDSADDNIMLGSSTENYIAGNYFHDPNQYRYRFCWAGVFTGDWSDKQWGTMTQDTTGNTAFFYASSSGSCGSGSGDIMVLYANDTDHLPARNNQYIWRLDADPTQIYFTPSANGDNAHTDMIAMQNSPRNTIIENNIFEDGVWGGQILKVDPVSSTTNPENIHIRNNLLYRAEVNNAYAVLLSGGADIYIYNNVIDASGTPYARAMRLAPKYVGTEDIYLYNNIISGAVYSGGTIHSDYNIWFTDPPDDFNEGTHSQVVTDVDSIFIDRDAYDYRLKENSPAINQADPTYTTDKDILGESRDANPDIGPYEYVAN